MIDRDHDLSVSGQARLLDISRSSVYYLPRPVSSGDLTLMRRIDELHLDYPFAGARMLRHLLGREGFAVGRLHVSTLMKRMTEESHRFPTCSSSFCSLSIISPVSMAFRLVSITDMKL